MNSNCSGNRCCGNFDVGNNAATRILSLTILVGRNWKLRNCVEDHNAGSEAGECSIVRSDAILVARKWKLTT